MPATPRRSERNTHPDHAPLEQRGHIAGRPALVVVRDAVQVKLGTSSDRYLRRPEGGNEIGRADAAEHRCADTRRAEEGTTEQLSGRDLVVYGRSLRGSQHQGARDAIGMSEP